MGFEDPITAPPAGSDALHRGPLLFRAQITVSLPGWRQEPSAGGRPRTHEWCFISTAPSGPGTGFLTLGTLSTVGSIWWWASCSRLSLCLVPRTSGAQGPRTRRRSCRGQERWARGSVRHMAGAQRETGRQPTVVLRFTGYVSLPRGPSLRGKQDGRYGPATKEKEPGMRRRSGSRVSASRKGPSRQTPPAPHTLPCPPPPTHAKGSVKVCAVHQRKLHYH